MPQTDFHHRHALWRAYLYVDLADECTESRRDRGLHEAHMDSAMLHARIAIQRIFEWLKRKSPPGWKQWYDSKCAQYPGIAHFKEHRDYNVHESATKVGQVVYPDTIGIKTPPPPRPAKDHYYFPKSPYAGLNPSQTPAIDFVRAYLADVESFVFAADKKYRFNTHAISPLSSTTNP